jgi:hypothetical protein
MDESIKIKGPCGKHTVTAIKVSDGVYRLLIVKGAFRRGLFADDPEEYEGLSFIEPVGGPFIELGSLASKYHPELPNLNIKKLEFRMDGGLTMHLDSIDDDLDEPLGVACRLEDPECESCQ